MVVVYCKRTISNLVINNQGFNTGEFTDGDLKRLIQKKKIIDNLKIKNFMTKNPLIVEENTLATDILAFMNKKKITNVCVFKKGDRKKTIGVIHIHNLLNILN